MDKKLGLIKMLSIEGVGRTAVKRLVDWFVRPDKISAAAVEDISKVGGLSMDRAREVAECLTKDDPRINEEIVRIGQDGYRIYCYGDKDYPRLLSEIYDPPIVIYSWGELKEEDYNTVAVVGTRKASGYGRIAASKISRELASRGLTIVSGCAIGIDTAAHEGALDAGGRTIAVLGSGLNQRYPGRNISLMEKISRNGAVISEFPVDTAPAPYNFPLRNRIISGLSLGTVVVEAPSKSGALITAYQALEQNRNVYAVPGSIFSFKSRGCVNLLKTGAAPVSSGEEVFEDIENMLNKEFLTRREKEFQEEHISGNGRKILEVLDHEPLHIDRIRARTDIDIRVLAEELTSLEIMGKVVQVEGKRYFRNKNG